MSCVTSTFEGVAKSRGDAVSGGRVRDERAPARGSSCRSIRRQPSTNGADCDYRRAIAIGHRGRRPARPPATNYSVTRGLSTTAGRSPPPSSVQTTPPGSGGFFYDLVRSRHQRRRIAHAARTHVPIRPPALPSNV